MASKPIRIVIDSNIIISSLVFGGIPQKLMEKVVREGIKIYTSIQLISEVVGVLRKKFKFSEEKIDVLEDEFVDKFVIVHPIETINVSRDVDDNRVLEAAIEGKCNYIVTGDSDLLVLKKYKNIKILSAGEFLSLNVFS